MSAARSPGDLTRLARRSLGRYVSTLIGVLILLMVVLVPFSCTTVADYEVAVLQNPITGNVNDDSFGQGLYFSSPALFWKRYFKYPTRELQYPTGGGSEIAQALTSDQLSITVDAAYRYRVVPANVVSLFLVVGDMQDVSEYVYTTYRTALRDAVAELSSTEILSTDRLQIAGRVETLMNQELSPKGIDVVRFFVREIQPPPTVKQAIELKLQREQEFQAQKFQTEIVKEQAEQKRQEAQGIRDAQDIIGQTLTPQYLSYYYMQTLQKVGEQEGNVIIAPTEGGNLLFTVPTRGRTGGQ